MTYKKVFECDVCKDEFYTLKEVLMHMYEHVNKKLKSETKNKSEVISEIVKNKGCIECTCPHPENCMSLNKVSFPEINVEDMTDIFIKIDGYNPNEVEKDCFRYKLLYKRSEKLIKLLSIHKRTSEFNKSMFCFKEDKEVNDE